MTQSAELKKKNLLSKKLTDGLKSVIPKTPLRDPTFCNYHLRPLVREIPSYIKDTNNFINKINNFPFLLVTMDVKSQYTVFLITKRLL